MLNLLKDLFNRWWRSWQLCMPVATVRTIWTETQLEHVTLLDVFISVLVHAVLLAALAVQPEETADGHPRLVVLVKEAAGVALHAKAAEPVPAHRLAEAPPTRRRVGTCSGVGYCCGSRVDVGYRSRSGIGLNEVRRPRGGGRVGGGTGIEATLEVEAENSLGVLH